MGIAPNGGSGDLILIVDDEPAQLKSLSSILKMEGMRPICCESVDEARTEFRRGGINVVILDLRIGDSDGLALLRQFKKIRPNVKAIIHTAYASLESAMEAINVEAFAYVRKMGSVDDLLMHVHRAFHEHLGQFSDQLKAEVERRTAELVEVNEQLKRDVAAREQAEQSLRESEERYRLLVENQSDMVVKFDTQGRLLFASPSYCETFDKSQDDLIGRAFMPLIHEEDRPRVEEAVASLAKPPHSAYVEERALTHDGWRWQSWLNTAILDKSGKVEAIIATGRDITERKRAENELRESEERFRRLAENAKDVIYRMTLSNVRFEYISPAVVDVFGYAAKDFYEDPKLVRKLMHPGWLDYFRAQKEKLLAGEMPPTYEYQIIHKDGSVRWIYQRNVLVRGKDGSPTAIEGIASDVTAYKQAERDLKDLNEELEERVRRRTTELEAANRELEAFAYSVSHDLRAPLRSIDGFSLALLEDYEKVLDAEGKDFIHRVRSGTQRMGRLIDDLLRLSRVTRAEMHLEVVDLSGLAEEIMAELRRESPEREVEFECMAGLSVHGDRNLLSVMMRNLLRNAWKFTGGKERAHIAFGETLHDGNAAYFVRDDGAGFDMAYQNKLFGAFQRLHSESQFEGTGIGLATVQRIIHRHGGRVWAEGAPDQGATFFFTL